MATYKVTYFDADMEVNSVVTYHNMNDVTITDIIVNAINYMNSKAVKVMKSIDNGDYYNVTEGFYHFAKNRI